MGLKWLREMRKKQKKLKQNQNHNEKNRTEKRRYKKGTHTHKKQLLNYEPEHNATTVNRTIIVRQHGRYLENKIMYACVELDIWPFYDPRAHTHTHRHGHHQTHKYTYGHSMLSQKRKKPTIPVLCEHFHILST